MDENKLLIDKPHDFQPVSPEQKENSMGTYLEYKCTKCGLRGKRYGKTVIKARHVPEIIWDNFLIVTGEKKRSLKEYCTGIGTLKERPFMVQITSKELCKIRKELKFEGVYITCDPPKWATKKSNFIWIHVYQGFACIDIKDCKAYQIKRKIK